MEKARKLCPLTIWLRDAESQTPDETRQQASVDCCVKIHAPVCVAKAPNQGCERTLVFQNAATCGRLRAAAAADCPLYCDARVAVLSQQVAFPLTSLTLSHRTTSFALTTTNL